MRPLRNALNELVERRLWPFALLLVLALVAVPVLLAKPGSAGDSGSATATMPADSPAAAAASASADAPPGGDPVVSVAQAREPKAPLRGHAKNPFRQQHVAASTQTSTTASTATAPSSGGSSGTTAPTAPSGTGGSGGSGNPAPPNTEPTYQYATIDVRFGHAGHTLRTIRDVPRLAPLPNATHPIIVFLGMRRDRETAVFLVSTDVHVQGLGHCTPSRLDCEAIALRRGETAFFDYTQSDGNVQQYELDLDAVTLHTTHSQALAQQAYARVSRVGKRLIRGGSARISLDGAGQRRRLPFRYVARSGVLHIAPWASKRARAQRAQGAISGGHLADLTPAP